MTFSANKFYVTSALVILLSSCGGQSNDKNSNDTTPQGEGEVSYKLSFTSVWNSKDFPTNFPSNPHFSPFVGATHSNQTRIWSTSETTSAGIEQVSETGGTSKFKTELEAKKQDGKVENIFTAASGSQSPGSQSFIFKVSKQFPLVSAISMIAPSPDWIVGIRDVNLYENNQWITSKRIELKLYDTGTDLGTQFSSGNQNGGDKMIKLLTSDSSDTDFNQGVHRTSGKTVGYIVLERQ